MMGGMDRSMVHGMMVSNMGRSRCRTSMRGRGHNSVVEAFQVESGFPLRAAIALVRGHDCSPLFESERPSGRRQVLWESGRNPFPRW
jgi:hypothetical protein